MTNTELTAVIDRILKCTDDSGILIGRSVIEDCFRDIKIGDLGKQVPIATGFLPRYGEYYMSCYSPETVRELAKMLLGRDTGSLESKCKIITQWLEQNQPAPYVVGLSGDQVASLADTLNDADYEYHFKSLSEIITEWLKTQTFTQTQFTPNWDDAPDWAGWYAESSDNEKSWFEHEPDPAIFSWSVTGGQKQVIKDNVNWKQTLQHRPRRGSSVKFGQIWKGEGIKVKVGCLGRVSKNGEDSIAFVDMDTNELKTWLLNTFLAKFELTGEQQ